MLDTETNAGGCSKHGPFHISGHANANCPEQANTKKTESEASKQEAWLNEERETTYRTLIDEIQEASEKGMSGGQYLAELVEKHAKDYGTKVRFGNWLKPEEYEKIRFVLLNSASLNEVAGTVIQRPLFVAEDEKTYQHLEAMFDMKAGDSHGVHFSPGFFDEKTPWGKVRNNQIGMD